jgi:hypothetical protein
MTSRVKGTRVSGPNCRRCPATTAICGAFLRQQGYQTEMTVL